MNNVRLRKRELFEAVGYHPHPGQEAVHRSRAPRRVLACGVRWGKTTCAAMDALAGLLAPRVDGLGWIVAPTLDVTDRTLRRVVGVVERHFAHRIREWNPRERKLVVRNLGGGVTELRAKTAETPDSLLGEGLDFLIVDEAARLKADLWNEHLSQRLIDRRGWALLISTPRGIDWFYKLYRRGQKGRDPAFQSWQAPTWSNPRIDPELIEAERERLIEDAFIQRVLRREVPWDRARTLRHLRRSGSEGPWHGAARRRRGAGAVRRVRQGGR